MWMSSVDVVEGDDSTSGSNSSAWSPSWDSEDESSCKPTSDSESDLEYLDLENLNENSHQTQKTSELHKNDDDKALEEKHSFRNEDYIFLSLNLLQGGGGDGDHGRMRDCHHCHSVSISSCPKPLQISCPYQKSLWQLIQMWISSQIKKCLRMLHIISLQWTDPYQSRKFIIKSYLDLDNGEEVNVPKIQQNGLPGPVLLEDETKIQSEKFLTPGAFLKLFFSLDLVQNICDYTNANFTANQTLWPDIAVGWTPVTPDEIYSFIALIIYCSTIALADMELYWYKEEEDFLGLFSHIWASSIMSQERYTQIQTFLKVENSQSNDRTRLRKIKTLTEQIRLKCMRYWQPNEYIRIEERIVEDSDSKWAVRLWHLQDAVTGYFWNFEFFLGKQKDFEFSRWWYETVVKLCSPLFGMGYKLFVDNLYNSVQLFKDLLGHGVATCGTISPEQAEFPDCLKDIRELKKSERGSMRWVRRDNLVFVQWKDGHIANVTSTMHRKANEGTVCTRKIKVDGIWQKVEIRQPVVIRDFLKYFGDKDRSEDVIDRITHLMRGGRLWKTVLYHMIDVARYNSFVMFQHYRNLEENKNVKKLSRPRKYKEIDFTIELVQELADIEEEIKRKFAK